jgi:SCY1-like protein 2
MPKLLLSGTLPRKLGSWSYWSILRKSPTTARGKNSRTVIIPISPKILGSMYLQISNNGTDILPIIELAIESPTHSIVDASLRSLPVILPILDFSTIKNELFPVIASVFSKTSSLAIKVRGLEAFVILCGGTNDPADSNDGLDGIMNSSASKKSSSTALDKYTMQEKIIPLIKGIKTKEPAVAVAALNVLRQVGGVADSDFVAMELLPILWSMSLGPLLDLKQFQMFMDLIKSLSSRVEAEQTKKLQELSGMNPTCIFFFQWSLAETPLA